MNIIAATTTYNTVASNLGGCLLTNISDLDDKQILYNFEEFQHSEYLVSYYIYPADSSRQNLLKDLIKNIVEWHVTVIYKADQNSGVDDSTYDLREHLMTYITEVLTAFAADLSLTGTCRVFETTGVIFESMQSPNEHLAIARILSQTIFYTAV